MNIFRFKCPYCGEKSRRFASEWEAVKAKSDHFSVCPSLERDENYEKVKEKKPNVNTITEIWV